MSKIKSKINENQIVHYDVFLIYWQRDRNMLQSNLEFGNTYIHFGEGSC